MYFRNKRRQNIGIVKMFFFGFDIVYIGQPKVTMDPQKCSLFPQEVMIHPQLVKTQCQI